MEHNYIYINIYIYTHLLDYLNYTIHSLFLQISLYHKEFTNFLIFQTTYNKKGQELIFLLTLNIIFIQINN